MTASFLSNPGPWMGWYLSPDTSGIPLYYTDERGFGSIIHHTNYHIPFVYKYMFGAWIVEAENYGGGPVGRAYIEVVQHPNCSGTEKGLSLNLFSFFFDLLFKINCCFIYLCRCYVKLIKTYPLILKYMHMY